MAQTPPWPEDPLPELARRAAARPAVVLDDDPTGTQTVRDVAVMTAWDARSIAAHLDEPLVFLSTNSRALDERAAVEATRAATAAVRTASDASGRSVSVISRGDSTLRGHVPAEPLAAAEALGMPDARILLAPYFGEGGRVTVNDVHLLVRDGRRVPMAETEFARDATFAYRSSNLRDWVTERWKDAGLPIPAIRSLDLGLVRRDGPDGVAAALRALPPRAVAIANAEIDRDIEVIALGALQAEEQGVPLIARTAASYVRARAGRPPAPSITRAELDTRGPGLIVVGSHVALTTAQLERLLASPIASRIDGVELATDDVLAGADRARAAVVSIAKRIDRSHATGRIGLVSTERSRRDVGPDGARLIASALVAIVERLRDRPGWVVGKGGITSFELAKHALGMREARVAGQLLPGVPVWVGAAASRFPGMPLVVFPGNVGDADALARAVEVLAAT